jgi:hypothetical protein
MIRWLPLLLLFVAVPAAAGTVLTESKAWPVTPGARVRLEFPVGQLEVEASDSDKVRLDLIVECDRGSTADCARKAKRVTLDARERPGQLNLEVEAPKLPSDFQLRAVLQVPRDLAVEIEMGVGELEVHGMRGDLGLELGVGEGRVRLAESSYREAEISVGIGEASIRAPGKSAQSSGFLGHESHWSGSGSARVKLRIGVGDGDIRLD